MKTLKGTLQVPGDKSISHRALIFAALSRGVSRIYGLSPAFDCISSADCLKSLGLKFERRSPSGNGKRESVLLVTSPGLDGLVCPESTLFAGNSGTTIRLLAGLLTGRPFRSELDGDDSLRRRPMARVLDPLAEMGAQVIYLGVQDYPPFALCHRQDALQGRTFELAQASAQVQTALLLAGLQADGRTTVKLPGPVRDHTERMFSFIGVPFDSAEPLSLTVERLKEPIEPFIIDVPADFSSAAFFMVAAACLPGSELLLTNLTINPGRNLALEVLEGLGADLRIVDRREQSGEPVADVLVRGKLLEGESVVDRDRLAAGIDEIPILALAACFGKGKLSVRNAGELRVKESDRLSAIIKNLSAAGASIKEFADGFEVQGVGRLKGASNWLAFDDHRMSMTGLIANLLSDSPVEVDNESCVAVSYPDFIQDLKRLIV